LVINGPSAEFEVIITTLSGDDWGTELQLFGNDLMIRPTQMSSDARKATRWGYCLKTENYFSGNGD
jgi:hypothetical protein